MEFHILAVTGSPFVNELRLGALEKSLTREHLKFYTSGLTELFILAKSQK